MAFLWKGDTLFTKKGSVPEQSVSEWTGFFLNLREPLEIPNAVEFGTFLATSMAFTTNIRQIEVFKDSERTHWYDKKVSEPRAVSFKSGEYTLTSSSSIFKLLAVAMRNIQVAVNAFI